MPRNGGMPPYPTLTEAQTQQVMYQQYMQQQQHQAGVGQYPMPPQVNKLAENVHARKV